MKKEFLILLAIFLFFTYLVFLLVKPFLSYVLSAFVLTFITYPIYHRVQKKLKNHTVSALLVIFLIIILILIPLVYLTTEVSGQAVDILSKLRSAEFSQFNFTEIEDYIFKLSGQEINIKDKIRTNIIGFTTYLGQSSLSFLGQVVSVLIGLFIMFFTMFYLYKDGPKLLETIKGLLPMKPEYKEKIFTSSKKVTWALLAGHFLIAIIQGVLSTISYIIFGLPNAIFWGFITVFAGIIPFMGAFMIFIPASLFMFFQGDLVAGLGILLVGLIIVSNVDNLIRPKFVNTRSGMHPVLVMLGVFGGLVLFGMIGIFIGPIVLALFTALVEVYMDAVKVEEKGLKMATNSKHFSEKK